MSATRLVLVLMLGILPLCVGASGVEKAEQRRVDFEAAIRAVDRLAAGRNISGVRQHLHAAYLAEIDCIQFEQPEGILFAYRSPKTISVLQVRRIHVDHEMFFEGIVRYHRGKNNEQFFVIYAFPSDDGLKFRNLPMLPPDRFVSYRMRDEE